MQYRGIDREGTATTYYAEEIQGVNGNCAVWRNHRECTATMQRN
jgi:hypothetical protein